MEKKEKNKSVKPKKGDVPKGAGKYNIPEIIEELKRKGAVGLTMLCNIVTEAAHILSIFSLIRKRAHHSQSKFSDGGCGRHSRAVPRLAEFVLKIRFSSFY